MSVGYNRLHLWSFIFHANNVPQLVVIDDDGNEFSYEEIEHLSRAQLAREYTIDSATAVFYI
jgi:uncharacterized protein YrzB (UPF0473 family)